MSRVARNFGFGHKTVARFWDSMCRAMQAHLNDHGRESDFFVNIANFEGSLKGKVGRKPKHDRKEVRRLVAEVPFSQRGDWRTLSSAVGIPKSTLHRMQKSEGMFKRQSNALKPSLTEANKLRRLQFARSEVNLAGGGVTRRSYVYNDMMDRVHVDEKWFFITRENQNYILLDEWDELGDDNGNVVEAESGPVRKVRHKSHIEKVRQFSADVV